MYKAVAEIDGRKGLQDSSCIIALQAVYVDGSVPDEEVTRLRSAGGASTDDKLWPQVQEKLQDQILSVISKKTQTLWTNSNEKTNEVKSTQCTTTNDNSYKFVLVFNYADRSLDAALRHDRISDPERRYQALQILLDVGEAISELHYSGRIHGDIKPSNIMREGTKWKLIDLDVSCPIGGKYGAKLPSSGYCPPEVAKLLFTRETKLQSFEPSEAHDLWSFGTIIFHILTGRSFLHTDEEGNLVEEEKTKLMLFDCRDRNRSLKNKNGISSEAEDLLRKLLHPDPVKRLQYFSEKEGCKEGDQDVKVIMDNVLRHDFFDEKTRLEGNIDQTFEGLMSINKRQSKYLRKMQKYQF